MNARSLCASLVALLCAGIYFGIFALIAGCDRGRVSTAQAQTAGTFDKEMSPTTKPILASVTTEGLPEFYGVYAADNGKIVDLNRMMDTPNFGRGMQILIFSRNVDSALSSLQLEFRDERTQVRIKVKPVPNQSQMVWVVPEGGSFKPGFYRLAGVTEDPSAFFWIEREKTGGLRPTTAPVRRLNPVQNTRTIRTRGGFELTKAAERP